MPEYLEDPSVLTKDKLKSELLANNVALPTGDQRKDVYVQLYLKNLTVQNNKIPSTDAFSSDEELPVPVVSNKSRSGRKATRKTDKPRPEDLDVTELTSEGLKDELLKYGINVGPIVVSTRKLYERRLQKLLDQGPPETVALPVVITQVDSNHNGNSDSDRYSDKEEEVTTEPEPVPVPVVERPVRSRGKTPVTTRTRSSQHNRIYAPEEEEEDDLEEEHPVLNIKRPLKRSSHRVDQMVPASDDTDVSELSAGEVVLPPPREAKTKAPLLLEALKEPKPILAEKPSSKSTPLLHGLAHAQSTRTIHQVVLTARAESPSPRLTQSVPDRAFPLNVNAAELWFHKAKPSRPPVKTPSHGVPEGHIGLESAHSLTPWQTCRKLCCEEDGGLPLTLTTKAPSHELNSLLNTALLEEPAPSVHAPVGQSIRPLKQWPLGVPQEIRPLLVANPSPLPRLSGSDPFASFTVRPVSYVSHTPSSPSLKEQLESLSSLSAKFDMLSNRFTRDQRESKNGLQPKWKQQKNTPFLSSVTPVKGQDSVSSSISKEPWVEKIAAGEQTPNRVDEKDVLKEMFPYETDTPTGINATCRRPIRGAAGRPLKSGDLWTDETLLRSSRSSYTESRTAAVHRVATLPPSTRLVTSVAPPAGKAIAPPHGLPVWLKLLLLGIVAGFIFFIYQTMETNAMAPFGGSSDSTQTSGREVRK
ncbi:lamina-associated polypeptide 2, isoforms beta/gamma isoform X2 [Salmo trutta]|uniref:Lamina-associated polypeptide 2, isoforms beta/gamma-like n=1 Tax=Salmo trutta TaxID=8032 RepID=A0A673W2W5_SALTR|nr:lamina-associated polypeptide 2, isoforms beta/gamma-like isoform X2 [Salmo trutta]